MGKITRTGFSAEYREIYTIATQFGEKNDCTVRAFALVAGISYAEAHSLLAKYRKPGQGMYFAEENMTHELRKLGFIVQRVTPWHMIEQYPGNHRNLKSVTTHHPRRFNKVWADGFNYLFFNPTHVAAVINGKTIDWTEGRAMRVTTIYRVMKVA